MNSELIISHVTKSQTADGRRRLVAITLSIFFGTIFAAAAFAQVPEGPRSPVFRIGEKLSYTVSFENVKDAAFLETVVMSQGKIGGKDAVEIRGRLKTFDIVSAAFRLIDEHRTVFADPQSGMPLLIKRSLNDDVLPRETVDNFLTTPSTSFDLLTAIYAIRAAGGNGSFSIFEDGETSILTAQTRKNEHIKTDAGEYETAASIITGSYLESHGIKQLKINLTIDEAKLPLVIQVSTARGVYNAQLSSVDQVVSESSAEPTPLPTPGASPIPAATPRPQVTPTPYIDDQPLIPELAFALGENLEYRITRAGRPAATLIFTATERRFVEGRDSLKLLARITQLSDLNGPLTAGDIATASVNPDTLIPIQSDMRFSGSLRSINRSLIFDANSGAVTNGAGPPVEAPIGTHTLLSLIYAMRSFNLRISKDSTNPVNDTRVAVFWAEKPYVFTLRPGVLESITIGSAVIVAQPVTINTGNLELDQLAIKVWLSTEPGHVPLRFSAGGYQADLIAASNTLIKK